MNQSIADVFTSENLERSVLIGYYGGGNFGDELLLEVLMNLFAEKKLQHLTVTYQHPERFTEYHHDFGYTRINMSDKVSVLKSIFKNKNIIIGGGGLWGLDVNPNIFLLSSLLFFSHFILRKNVFMFGVGYYTSTSTLGHISAWLAGKSARHIVVRDRESKNNFRKITNHVNLDRDIAFQLPSLNLKAYEADLQQLEAIMPTDKKTLFITIRRFKPGQSNHYNDHIKKLIADNPNIPIIVTLLEPRNVDPEGYDLLQQWGHDFPHIHTFDFSYNPFALYLFFEQHHKNLILIAPQFHAIIVALLTDVPFLPIVYDNKVAELLKVNSDEEQIKINELTQKQLQTFIMKHIKSQG